MDFLEKLKERLSSRKDRFSQLPFWESILRIVREETVVAMTVIDTPQLAISLMTNSRIIAFNPSSEKNQFTFWFTKDIANITETVVLTGNRTLNIVFHQGIYTVTLYGDNPFYQHFVQTLLLMHLQPVTEPSPPISGFVGSETEEVKGKQESK